MLYTYPSANTWKSLEFKMAKMTFLPFVKMKLNSASISLLLYHSLVNKYLLQAPMLDVASIAQNQIEKSLVILVLRF